jgi:hypothetical protein
VTAVFSAGTEDEPFSEVLADFSEGFSVEEPFFERESVT